MTAYETRIRKEVTDFVDTLKRTFAGEYDYIEAADVETSDGLDHLDEYEDAFNENPLEITVGFPGVNDMTIPEFEAFDARVNAAAEQNGVAVRSTAGNGDYVEYTYYLHAAFFDVPN